jgi:hypothetical protein
MARYFNRSTHPFCPFNGQDHRVISESVCSGCKLHNPEFRPRPAIPANAEIIPISDDSPVQPPRPAPSIDVTAPPRKNRYATHLPRVPSLVVGYAEQERQASSQREADRKSKTGIKPTTAHTIFCSVGLAKKMWDEWGESGSWATCQDDYQWSVSLPDSELTSERFLADLLLEMKKRIQREEIKDWITPKSDGYWVISHVNPRTRNAPREIAGWDRNRCLSDAIE